MNNTVKALKTYNCVLACLCCMFSVNAHADLALATYDWDPNPGAGAWTSLYSWTQVDVQTTGGNTGQWLSVTFTNTATGPDDSWDDIVATDATNLYPAPWTNEAWIAFDFWASNQIPTSLAVRWQGVSGYIWGNAITIPTSLLEWNPVRTASFEDWNNWVVDPFAIEANFLSDLASMEWMGIFIRRTEDVEQIYGIDNFRLMVPEPAEYIFLASACAVALASRRRWLSLRRWIGCNR
jgi:hypothetical protein